MDESFPSEDRKLLHLLIDHPLDETDTLVARSGASSPTTFRRHLSAFCERYQCRMQIQITNWERIGLHPFFMLTSEPMEHPYAVRQYKLIGNTVEYLTQFVAPSQDQIPVESSDVFPLTQIYRPTNNIRLLYDEARTISFNDEWLLNLKEVMVEQGMGDLLYQQDPHSRDPLPVDSRFLERLLKFYLRDELGLFKLRVQVQFIRRLSDFMTPYFDLQLPGMRNYLLILAKTLHPKLFAGGFLGQFPLTELYESSDTLICRFQLPEPSYSKLSFLLFTHLSDLCIPYSWMLRDDTRMFQLQEQWVDGHWKEFQL